MELHKPATNHGLGSALLDVWGTGPMPQMLKPGILKSLIICEMPSAAQGRGYRSASEVCASTFLKDQRREIAPRNLT